METVYPKTEALLFVYKDIIDHGHPKPFVYLSKGGLCFKDHPIGSVKKNLNEWVRHYGKTAKELGSERVYFFWGVRVYRAVLPKPVPLDDKDRAVFIFMFDVSEPPEIKVVRPHNR